MTRINQQGQSTATGVRLSTARQLPVEIPRHLKRTSTYCRLLSFADPSSEINCGFVRYQKPGKRVFQTHPQYYGLLMILMGSGTLVTKDKKAFVVGPGDVIQITRGSSHTLLPDSDDWLEASVSLDHAFIERFLLLNNFDPHQPVLRPGLSMKWLREFEELHDTLPAAPRDQLPQFMLRIQQLIFQLHHAGHVQPLPNPEHQQLEQACLLLEDENHFNLNLEQVADELNVAYRQLRYLFKKHLRESPGQYRLKRKMAAASALLVHEHMSISQIAERLGYADPFTFSRQFKAFHGISPRQYRKR